MIAAPLVPVVTVVIPCHNSAQWVAKAIESVLRQSGEEVEVVAVNDGSTDETLSILKGFGNRIRVIDKPNSGVVSARRAGVSAAKGRFIKFLDSDDEIPSGGIESILNAAALFPEDGFIGRSIEISDTGINVGQSMYNAGCKPAQFSVFPREFLLTQATPSGLWLLPRKLFASHDLFGDPNIHLGEEYSFCIRIIRSGATIRFMDDVIYAARIHEAPGRLSRSTDEVRHLKQVELIGEAIRVVRNEIPEHDVTALAKIACLCWTRGRDCLRMGNGLAAKRYFKLAGEADRSVGPVGRLSYRTICKVLGPLRTEGLFELVKRLRW